MRGVEKSKRKYLIEQKTVKGRKHSKFWKYHSCRQNSTYSSISRKKQ